MSSARFLLLLAASFSPIAAQAEDAPPARDDLHGNLGTDIVVTAPFARERFTLPTAVAVLDGEALLRDTRPSIGETLARQPGVSSSFFGPNASRPILRGLDSERVRVLTDGIGSFDVSNVSADHAVAINPLTADRVEVVRGPASLLFGSSAIGGVVNVTDRRIAREIPEEFAHIDATANFATAAKERGVAGSVDVPLGRSGLVAHADGSFLKTGDYRVGGHIFSKALREEAEHAAEHEAEHHPEEHEAAEVAEKAQAKGRVPNTDSRTWEVAGGLSWIGEKGNFGVSVARMESNYGIPGTLTLAEHHHGHDDGHDDHDDHDHDDEHDHDHEGHSHDNVRIDMRQTRLDARAEVPMFGAFEALKFRFGFADYRHDEVEETGEIGTSFFSKGLEGRLELVQRDRDGWKGASGVQYVSRRFRAEGEEATVPLNITDQVGLFTVQSKDLGGLKLEVGARYENTRVRSTPIDADRRFNAFSGSGGVSVPLGDAFRISGSLAYTERAPAAEELFSNGAHAATRSYEIGNPDLKKERSLGAEAVLRGRGEGWRLEVSGFFNRFYDFIYLNPTGEEEHELPVFAYSQDGARHWGFEAEGRVTLFDLGETRVEATGLVDFVRADILGGKGAAPRIPPLRFIAGLEADGGPIGGRVEVEHATKQDRVTEYETETPGWTMVNASVSWKPFGADSPTMLIASVNNIFDVEARRHSSFLKEFAPLPGRDFRLGARLSF
ncbi:TonB-dependent receptor [Sandaracinobacter sp. RS1-74]|uniref:TonB-dependent receptor n=1 Tax=Sandaracinobacteroides sayramensis TaxID=2913411 RepID=UPI001ED9E8A8|nr:TonB-dependent receptor [Sandaracinobacteroides sayramensis]MCG2842771.1 TonB-dependent receptor [Sandaracinobacteroides sayramensis]